MTSHITLGRESASGGVHTLPLDVATESIAIISRKGAGKTHTARALAEDLIGGHVQTLVIDPLDVWWGLRVAADGKGDGLDIVIFGGAHADLPLLETSGAALADLIVDKGINAVLVLDALTQGSQYRFMTDFATRLYERKGEQANRTPLHIIVDEADSYVAQKPFPEAMRCLGAMDRIVRRGRSRGMGTTLITQRPAVISKDVLTQTEILISLQVTAPQDRKALQDWINANATKGEAKEYLESLASMQRGEAWVWSPAKLKCFYRVKIRQTRTFDSSFTPAVGKTRVTPKLKDLDLTAIRAGLESVIQEAEDNDPKKLRLKIKALEKRLGDSKFAVTVKSEVTVAQAWQMCLSYIKTAVREAVSSRDLGWQDKLHNLSVEDVPFDVDRWMELKKPDSVLIGYPHHRGIGGLIDLEDNPKVVAELAKTDAQADRRRSQREAREKVTAAVGPPMKPSQRRILVVLAQHHAHHQGEALLKSMLAVRAGYSLGGTFDSLLSTLRTQNFLEAATAKGSLRITGEGLDALGDFERLPLGPALCAWWKMQLKPSQCKVLDALTRRALHKVQLAEATGYALGGTFDSLLSTLRTKGLIVGDRGEPLDLHSDLKD